MGCSVGDLCGKVLVSSALGGLGQRGHQSPTCVPSLKHLLALNAMAVRILVFSVWATTWKRKEDEKFPSILGSIFVS